MSNVNDASASASNDSTSPSALPMTFSAAPAVKFSADAALSFVPRAAAEPAPFPTTFGWKLPAADLSSVPPAAAEPASYGSVSSVGVKKVSKKQKKGKELSKFSFLAKIKFKKGVVITHSEAQEIQKHDDEPLLLDLESAEAKALARYTDEDYETINKEHRDGNLSEKTAKDTAHIKAALDKLPSHQGDVYRGNDLEIWGWYDLSVGKIFCDPAFLSTSKKLDTAEEFGMQGAGNGVIFVIKCKHAGKYIAPYAVDRHHSEDEVLFPPGTKFLITKVVKEQGNDRVWMEEIVDDEPSKPAAIDGNDSTTASPEVTLPVAVSTPDAVVDVEITTPAAAPVPLVTPTSGDSAMDGGSVWINGRRRSARHQPQLGSVFVNGLRRSARFRP